MLRLENLSKEYHSSEGATPVLDRISLSLGDGESLAILGPTGCGKSTLLYLISGLVAPTSGEVIFNEKPLNHPHQKIALVLQEYGLFPWKTVKANVELGLRIRNRTANGTEVQSILKEMGIEEKSEMFPRQLSGGQKQRVALARALILEPSLLLLDEPFAALDTLTRERLQDLCAKLWKSLQFGMILVTHNIQESVRLGKRILVMSSAPGRKIAEIENPHALEDGQRGSDPFYKKTAEVRKILESQA